MRNYHEQGGQCRSTSLAHTSASPRAPGRPRPFVVLPFCNNKGIAVPRAPWGFFPELPRAPSRASLPPARVCYTLQLAAMPRGSHKLGAPPRAVVPQRSSIGGALEGCSHGDKTMTDLPLDRLARHTMATRVMVTSPT
jgi:hypothetical protein